MIFRETRRPLFGIDEDATDKDAKRSLDLAYDDVLNAGVDNLGDSRLSDRRRRDIFVATAVGDETIVDQIHDDLAPLDPWTRGSVLSKIEELLRESVLVAYAAALVSDEAATVAKSGAAEAMRAARTSPERERAIDDAIARSNPGAKKRINMIIADVAKAGFSIKRDAVRKRLEKCAS